MAEVDYGWGKLPTFPPSGAGVPGQTQVPNTGATPPKPTVDPGAGRQWVYDPLYGQWTSETMPEWIGNPSSGAGGAGADHYGADLSYKLGLKGLEVDWAKVGIDRQRIQNEKAMTAIQAKSQAETSRSNKAQEYEARKQRALDAASSAVSAYLKGTELSDARRLASFQEARELLRYQVDPSQEYQAGMGPGGALSQAVQGFGMNFDPQKLPKSVFEPGKLQEAPTTGQIGAGIMSGIGGIKTAGAAGQQGPGS